MIFIVLIIFCAFFLTEDIYVHPVDDHRSYVVLNIFFEAKYFSFGNKKQPLKAFKNEKGNYFP